TIAARAITLVRDRRNVVPLRAATRVLSITVATRTDLLAGVHFDAALRDARVTTRSLFIDADGAGAPDYARARLLADSADAVVVSSYVATRWDAATIAQSAAFVDFVQTMNGGRVPLIIVALGNPYLLLQIPNASEYIVGWSGAPT